MRHRGFTLVEMLAVVTLIVLLISMLLPAMARGRDNARLLECGSHLRAQSGALVEFALDNVSRLPVYDPQAASGGNVIGSPVLTYRVGVAPGDGSASEVTVRNHGVLYEQNYLTSAEAFYCPTQRGAIWQLELYVQPWLSGGSRGHIGGQAVPGANWLVRSAYLYSPHRVDAANNRRAHQRLQRFPQDKALMMDLLFATQFYDTVAHNEDTAWNVLHADGSVRSYENRSVYSQLDAYPRLEWPEFELVMDALMHDNEYVVPVAAVE